MREKITFWDRATDCELSRLFAVPLFLLFCVIVCVGKSGYVFLFTVITKKLAVALTPHAIYIYNL